jgi:hypothetical protein
MLVYSVSIAVLLDRLQNLRSRLTPLAHIIVPTLLTMVRRAIANTRVARAPPTPPRDAYCVGKLVKVRQFDPRQVVIDVQWYWPSADYELALDAYRLGRKWQLVERQSLPYATFRNSGLPRGTRILWTLSYTSYDWSSREWVPSSNFQVFRPEHPGEVVWREMESTPFP